MGEPEAEKKEPVSCVADLTAGGVNVRLEGPDVTGTEAYALWQKVYDTVSNARNRIGSGTGFVPERAEPMEPALWLGEGGPKMDVGDVRSEAGRQAARRLGFRVRTDG
jgi:hypothetical protein